MIMNLTIDDDDEVNADAVDDDLHDSNDVLKYNGDAFYGVKMVVLLINGCCY